ncbi:MAG: molybdate ABC transporter substrate-binding protein [Anaerolineales bacterium]|nr:molybdate ABC transporter substrate-binding protein [Anaerolineales bacterium]MCB9144142.1 molybdate ABC transporter substrate-binding protein [Anaerolineales bacterium]
MKRLLSLTLLLSIFLTACGASAAPTPVPVTEAPTLAPTEVPPTATSKPESQTLLVFAAASLTDAFTEIGAAFDAANPGVTTTFNFAGSQALRTQIEEGAPADVFASANKTQMDAVIAASLITEETQKNFLTNKLVVILPANNPAALEKLEDLAKPGIKLVLAAKEVPVGKYSLEAFNLMNGSFGIDFKDKVLANVVSNEDNVKQVVAKVQLGEADAGIVYTSDAIAAPDLKTLEIPADVNVIAKYPIAPLSNAKNAELAAEFIEYVLSAEGQAILAKWGFIPVK